MVCAGRDQNHIIVVVVASRFSLMTTNAATVFSNVPHDSLRVEECLLT